MRLALSLSTSNHCQVTLKPEEGDRLVPGSPHVTDALPSGSFAYRCLRCLPRPGRGIISDLPPTVSLVILQ